ncbi:HHE domain-containing protein [Pochonia chlamydosporia 170]|uniref:HHE domain-containing protein n=1 Tax=Pochonia chlamydosporia 170 TaxID=1380566 RepID=A0A179FI86_METCM|nr:HHE domain-containing protein [Pochonia chlamydosporia 170]OAQ65264.1 HHE domain-containing protein [Pochonia chlamydosporia 170]
MSNSALLRISEVIKLNHRELEQYYDNIVNSGDKSVQERYQNIFIWELARHCIGEEIILYPAIESYVKNGQLVVARHRLENQQLMDTLRLFQSIRPGDAEFLLCIQSLFKDLGKRIKEEEAQDLIPLEKALENQDSYTLASNFQRTKGFVPTRSHPMSSKKPPFDTLDAFLATPVDKLANLLPLTLN